MSEIAPRGVIRRLTTTTSETGLYPGEVVSVFVNGVAPALYQWDAAGDVWNQFSDLGENVDFLGTLDVTGVATFDAAVTITGQADMTAGASLGTTDIVRKTKTIAITATQLRTLAASPVTLVAADAAAVHIFRGALFSYRGGANVFDSVGAGEDLQVRYTNGSGILVSAVVDTTSDVNLGATTDVDFWVGPLSDSFVVTQGAALVLDNVGAGELATSDVGAAGDGTIEIQLHYDSIIFAP